ncbi:MAG: methylmalonyl Co-A mutase-associated GTPase MeaB [Oligoflexales bacterium]
MKNSKTLAERIIAGDKQALAKAITLVESKKAADQEEARTLVETLLPRAGKSIRIGISGSPGVGKSSFIERFGTRQLSLGRKIAILAIDPSSQKTSGSILGDKTRMPTLSVSQNVFIRPSPAGESLGGVAQKTRENILLCEAAGFDLIIVETVGVGQSETLVSSMVDVMALLQLPNAGDDIQGIKKGILETSDILVITKNDGSNEQAALKAKTDHMFAISLTPSHSTWKQPIVLVSSIRDTGFNDFDAAVSQFLEHQRADGKFEAKRSQQNIEWIDRVLNDLIQQKLSQLDPLAKRIAEEKQSIADGRRNALAAAHEIYAHLDFRWKP